MASLGSTLLQILQGYGVSLVFGLPGDYILSFCHEIEKKKGMRFIPLSTEAGVGFAAEGAARSGNRLGVVCVTYGVGALSLANAVACAYAEMTPLVVISGGPASSGPTTDEKTKKGILLHHQVKDSRSQLRIYKEITEYATVLNDPKTAAAEIHKAVRIALQTMRPVYLEIPRDRIDQEIAPPLPQEPLTLPTDEESLKEASAEILGLIQKAKRPMFLVGIEVHRRRLREKVIALSEKLRLPVASTFLARGTYPSNHPQYLGTYLGRASRPGVQKAVEGSDCLVMLGVLLTDTGMAVHLKRISKNIVQSINGEVLIQYHKYENVPLERMIDSLLQARLLSLHNGTGMKSFPKKEIEKFPLPHLSDRKIKIQEVIGITNYFLHHQKQMLVVADTGDCLMASYEIRADRILAPAYYTTMGFAIPAALGVQVATGERPIVIVGDGAFQMSAAELSHYARYKINPIMILLNNQKWGMIHAFLPEAKYNDLINWPYAELARLWGGNGFVVKTPREFKEAFEKAYASKKFSLLEVQLQEGDITQTLKTFVREIEKKPQ